MARMGGSLARRQAVTTASPEQGSSCEDSGGGPGGRGTGQGASGTGDRLARRRTARGKGRPWGDMRGRMAVPGAGGSDRAGRWLRGPGATGELTVLSLLLHLVGPAGLRTAGTSAAGRAGQRGPAPSASGRPGSARTPRAPKPPPRAPSATPDSLKVSGRHRKRSSTQPKPGPETGTEGRTRLPVPPPRAARPRRPQRLLRTEVEAPAVSAAGRWYPRRTRSRGASQGLFRIPLKIFFLTNNYDEAHLLSACRMPGPVRRKFSFPLCR